jgi:hypothetical protein
MRTKVLAAREELGVAGLQAGKEMSDSSKVGQTH